MYISISLSIYIFTPTYVFLDEKVCSIERKRKQVQSFLPYISRRESETSIVFPHLFTPRGCRRWKMFETFIISLWRIQDLQPVFVLQKPTVLLLWRFPKTSSCLELFMKSEVQIQLYLLVEVVKPTSQRGRAVDKHLFLLSFSRTSFPALYSRGRCFSWFACALPQCENVSYFERQVFFFFFASTFLLL